MAGLQIGQKVVARGSEADGFGSVVSYAALDGRVDVSYHVSPVERRLVRIPLDDVRRQVLPRQTRCFVPYEDAWRVGRVERCEGGPETGEASYLVRFPNQSQPALLRETEFNVRSYIGSANPVETLACLAHETPFFYERRSRWVASYEQYKHGCSGLTGLASARIEIFSHQLEVVRRVLSDPTVRYVLADEVGLGKTIEAGAIARQLFLDARAVRAAVLAPAILVPQWKSELATRFGLGSLPVVPYARLPDFAQHQVDFLIVDEAHRLLTAARQDERVLAHLTALCHPNRTRHLLLLTGTPILHRQRDLLALLHLLEPDGFPLDDEAGFAARLALRMPIGSAFSQLSRATTPALRARAAVRLQDVLPHDTFVVGHADLLREAAAAKDASASAEFASALCTHVAETYRIHRRLLRVRRAALLETGEPIEHRRRGRTAAHATGALSQGAVHSLWRDLDEWRVRAAGRAAASSNGEQVSQIFAHFAAAIATADDSRSVELSALVEAVPVNERLLLSRIEAALASPALFEDRIDALRHLIGKDHKGAAVVFCSTPAAALRVHTALVTDGAGLAVFGVYSGSSDRQEALRQFRSSDKPRVLIADASAEEGLNLQFAERLILWDVPADPMRIEQRIGRLDRRDRRRGFTCDAVLSSADPELAFDAAWHLLLQDGLGVFDRSIADLQYLMDGLADRVGRVAFEGGPAAVAAMLPALVEDVRRERERTDEEEAIDGLRLSSPEDSPTWSQLDAVDADEDAFAESLIDYARQNLRLDFQRGPQKDTYFLRGADPLVPAERLVGLQGYGGRAMTFRRNVATSLVDAEFLRPGHPLVEALRGLAAWDDRGQAFAMWRRLPGVSDPILVFVAGIAVSLDIPSDAAEDAGQLDFIGRACLLRLAATWQPSRWWTAWLRPDGEPVSAELEALLRRPYSREDVNLGGARATVLVDLARPARWHEVCRQAAAAALAEVQARPAFREAVREGRRAARAHFDMLRSRLRARASHLGDSTAGAVALGELERTWTTLDSLLSSPSLRIDTLGAYALSENAPTS